MGGNVARRATRRLQDRRGSVVQVPDWKIVISDEASELDQSALRHAMHEFNQSATGYRDGSALSCFLYEEDRLAAAIHGYSWGGCAQIEYLWVAEAHRAKGWGSRLLAAAEQEARRRGCSSIVLDSHSFQAPELYRSRGYIEIGKMVDVPRGYSQIFFQKPL